MSRHKLPTPRHPDIGFLHETLMELRRARVIHPREEGVLTDAEWLAVLVEEVGECARAMQDETDDRLREELVQVAAMSARWAGAIPRGRLRVPWSTRPCACGPNDPCSAHDPTERLGG